MKKEKYRVEFKLSGIVKAENTFDAMKRFRDEIGYRKERGLMECCSAEKVRDEIKGE